MMEESGLNASFRTAIGISLIAIGALMLFPKTFLLGNILSAMSFAIIMALALNAENYKMTLIEIPFLAISLLLIWLKYPFKNLFNFTK